MALFTHFISNRFSISANLKNILQNSGWLMFEQIFRAGAGIIVGIWVARYLGPEDFGMLNFSVVLVSMVVPFANLGLDGIGIRELVNRKSETEVVLGTVFGLKLAGAILLVVIALAVAWVVRPHNPTFLILVSFAALGIVLKSTEAIDLYFRSIMKNQFSVWSKSVGLLFASLVKGGMVLTGLSVVFFGFANFVEALLAGIFFIFFYKASTRQNFPFLQFSVREAKNLLRDSWPLIFSGFFAVLFLQIDQVMLGILSGDATVGVYNVAVRLSTIFYLIPMALTKSSFPVLFKTYLSSKVQFEHQVLTFLTVMAVFSYAIVVMVAFFSEDIILILFGNAYAVSSQILMIHIFSIIFVFSGLVRGPWIIAKNLTQFVMISNLAGALFNILLNLILIPKFEGVGAAWATLISYAIAYVVMNAFYSKTFVFFKMQIKAFLLIPCFKRV